jgi:hypothetical protein
MKVYVVELFIGIGGDKRAVTDARRNVYASLASAKRACLNLSTRSRSYMRNSFENRTTRQAIEAWDGTYQLLVGPDWSTILCAESVEVAP